MQNRLTTLLSCTLLAALLTACGTNPANLEKPKELTRLKVTDPIALSPFQSLVGNERSERQMLPGFYVAKYVDSSGGVYHMGPSGAYQIKLVATEMPQLKESLGKISSVSDGGIYVPKEKSDKARVFIVLGTARKPAETAVASQIATPGIDNTSVIVSQVPAGASPAASGIGAGAAAGIIAGIQAYENGNVMFIGENVEYSKFEQLPAEDATPSQPASPSNK